MIEVVTLHHLYIPFGVKGGLDFSFSLCAVPTYCYTCPSILCRVWSLESGVQLEADLDMGD